MLTKTLATTALVLGAFAPAGAAELGPVQAGTFPLGDRTASVYYTAQGDTYQVVTTVGPADDGTGEPIRFTGSLRPGDTQTVSVGWFGTAPQVPVVLELTHAGATLVATSPAAPTE